MSERTIAHPRVALRDEWLDERRTSSRPTVGDAVLSDGGRMQQIDVPTLERAYEQR